MERLTVKQVVQNEYECVARQQCDRNCAKCDLVMDAKDILSAYDHVLELLGAEEQGLLVRLPCKVGDTVYSYSHDKQIRALKCEGFLFTGICWKARCTDLIPSWVGNQKRHFYIMFSSFGKTVFLTREEAEAALAKEATNDG